MMSVELWAKRVGKCVWMAMALAVPARLWLGGVISPHRDRALITELVQAACFLPANHLYDINTKTGTISFARAIFSGSRGGNRKIH